MSYLTERASYLSGLAEGLGFDSESNEGKLFNAMIDVIAELSEEVALLEERLEEVLDEDSDFDFGDDMDDCCGEDELDYFEITCEKCGNTIYLDEDLLDNDDELKCPVCGEEIEIEFEDCCGDDCDCDCDDCK